MPKLAPGKIRGIIDVRDGGTLFDDSLSTASQYDRWADEMVDALRPYVNR